MDVSCVAHTILSSLSPCTMQGQTFSSHLSYSGNGYCSWNPSLLSPCQSKSVSLWLSLAMARDITYILCVIHTICSCCHLSLCKVRLLVVISCNGKSYDFRHACCSYNLLLLSICTMQIRPFCI